MPANRFDHVHIDAVSPLPPSGGCPYLLTMVDRYARWPEAVPDLDVQIETLWRYFLYKWVARFGIPRLLTSDRGAQFTSAMWASMSTTLGMKLAATTAYHPESNRMVERMHCCLKEALEARLTGPAWMPVGHEGHHQGRLEGLPH